MTILTTRNLSKYFGGQDVFSNLNLSINNHDRIALVGSNGAGKTTLLKIMAGLETADDGNTHTMKGLRVGYLEQHPSLISGEDDLWGLALGAFAGLRQQEAEIQAMAKELDTACSDELLERYGEAQARFEHEGGYSYEQKIEQVLSGLGFKQKDYKTSLKLFSGGQQSRARLARLLLEQPDLLLFDEPTNHLDLNAVEWLENYLQSWAGAFVVVSHDRYFLDKVASWVWEISYGSIETYRGNFSHYIKQRAERFERRQEEYKAQQKFIAKEKDFIQRNIAGQRSKEAQGRRKRMERMPKFEPPRKQKKLKLPLQTTLRSGDKVMEADNLAVGYPDNETLFACSRLEIRRGDRVALLGPNGAGKTTFVKTVLGQLSPKGGTIKLGAGVKMGYFAQTQASLDLKATVLDEVLAVKNLPIGEARNYLGSFLFHGNDVFKPIKALSGGERSRVALAKLILTGSNFLILDEPTNHLDIPSQETLENVLAEFNGTILLVSHDRYFINALASHIWMLTGNNTITTSKGGYGDYLAYCEAQQTGSRPKQVTNKKSSSLTTREQDKAEQRTARKKEKQIAKIENIIELTENKLAQLLTQLELASQIQDVPELQKLGRDYKITAEKLELLMSQWVEIEAAQ